MEILIKKDISGKTTTNIKEISEVLNIASLMKQLRELKASIEEVKKTSKIKQKDVLALIPNEFIKKGEMLNISSAASIEKLKSIPSGMIYYNKNLDVVRLKRSNGWVTLKFE